MKKPMFTKVLSLVLAFVLILGMLPVSAVAHAAEVTGLEPDVSSQILDADTTTTPEETEDAELIASASTDAPTEDTAATAEETEAPADTEAPKSTEAAPTETEATTSTEAAPEENETTEVTEPKAPENGIVAKIAAAIAGPVTRAANTLSFWGSYIINGNTTITWASGDYRHGIGRMELGGVTAYCIQPGVITKEGFTYSGLTVDQTIQKLGSGTTGQNKYRAISLIMAYGWPNNSFPNNPNSCSVAYGQLAVPASTWHDTEKYMATQILIWEVALGYRSATPPYSRTNASLYNMFYKNDAGPGEWKTFQDTYNTIVNRMSQTTNKIPSFTSNFAGNARTYKLTYDPASGNYKTTLTDTNSALSGYTMPSISGITFSKSGSTLTITATPAAAAGLQNGKLCTATGTNCPNVDSNTVRAFWGSGNRQAIVTPIGGRFDPTPAYFRLQADAFGVAKVIKTSDDGKVDGFQFTLWQGSTKLETKQTDANGNITFTTNLTPGTTYTVKETPIPGYEVLEDQTFTAQAGKTQEVTFSNKTINTVQVVKTSEDGVVAGRIFRLLDENKQELEVQTTNENGVAAFTTKLTLGTTYWMAEDDAPGYAHQEAKSFVATNGLNTVSFENVLKKWTLTVTKKDAETWAAQGEAKLGGAVYGIYKGGELVDTYTTDENGSFTTKTYICDSDWSVKEISAPTGYLLNAKSYHIGAEEGNFTLELNNISMDVTDRVIKGKVEIIKTTQEGLDKHEVPEDGAEFQIYLASADSYDAAKETERDILVTDKDGHAASKNLPYGTYTVHQVSGWEGRDFVADFTVTINENGKTYTYALLNPTQYYPLRVAKVDAETQKPVAYAQAGFRIYDPDGTQIKMTINGYTIDTFYTDDTGSFITPLELPYGKGYSLVEVQAPQGYILDSTPITFDVTRNNAQDNVIRIVRENAPQKGVITIEKTGEVFSSVTVIGGGYVDEDGKDTVLPNLYQPVYEVKGLPGATFEIIAAQDIMTQDGTVRYTEGQVVDTITTGEDGKATSKELYLGSYKVREIKAPVGFVLDGTQYNVVLEYAGQSESLVAESVSVTDQRQKAVIDLSKIMEQDEIFGIGNKGEIENVTFGLYARNEITALDGTKIPADGLLEIGKCSENGSLTFTADPPLGSYYAAELATDEHYILSDAQYDLAFIHDENTAVANISGPEISNVLIRGSVLGHKQDRETGEVISGAVFGLFRENETVFTENTAILTSVSDENGEFRFDDLAVGKYIVRELAPAEGFLPNEESYPVTISRNEQVVEFVVDNDRIPELHTTATSEGEKETYATPKIIVEDLVDFEHLVPGKEYTVKGVLMDKATGLPFLVNGKEVVSEVTFVPEEPSGSVMVSFEFDGSGIVETTELVVFEDLYKDGKLLTTHADIDDDGQTVIVHSPKIHTTATVGGAKEIGAADIITLDDVVAYDDVIPGEELLVHGFIVDKATGDFFRVNGKTVYGEVRFTPEEAEGEITVSFTFDGRGVTADTDLVVFEYLHQEKNNGSVLKTLASHEDVEDVGQTVTLLAPEIHTTATVDGEKEIGGADVITLEDVVVFEHLIPGKEYLVKGILMNKLTGEPLLINGEEVTAETLFTPEEANGTVVVTFSFDARCIKEETQVVAFESMERDGVEIAVHADLEDEGQTVTVTPPEIHTMATVDGGKTVTAGKPITVRDVVSYKGLISGKEYAVKGVLMNKSTGTAYLVDGKEITAEATFVAETEDGEVKMFFTFDTKGIDKTTELVAFETVYREGVEVGVHADLNDKDQTVTIVPPTPHTGVGTMVIWGGVALATTLLLGCGVVTLLALRRKKEN